MLEKFSEKAFGWFIGTMMAMLGIAAAFGLGYAMFDHSKVCQYLCWSFMAIPIIAIGSIVIVGGFQTAAYLSYRIYLLFRFERQRNFALYAAIAGGALIMTGAETMERSILAYVELIGIVTVAVGIVWLTDYLPLRLRSHQ